MATSPFSFLNAFITDINSKTRYFTWVGTVYNITSISCSKMRRPIYETAGGNKHSF
jgi:hypothetical protein